MHVALLNQYYWPHGSATSQLLTELGEGLAERGHRVTAITARVDDGAGGATPLAERARGVDVRRVPATRRGKRTILHRLSDYGTFYAGAVARLATLRPRPDAVIALTTPPLIAVASQLTGALRRFPTVSVVQDVYPDVAVELGVLSAAGAPARLWRQAARLSLRASARVVVLSEPMRARVRALGVGDDHIETIPNWALREMDAPATGERYRFRYGFGDRFVVMYSGNMGKGHDFDTLLAAAERLRDREDIVFAFVGDGVRRAEIEGVVRARSLSNVALYPYAPRADLAESLAAADCQVITMRDGLEGLIVPSKLYGVLACGRPALYIGPGGSVVAQTIAAAAAGQAHPTGAVDGVVATLEALAARSDRGRALGAAGRRYFEQHLGRDRAIDRYEDLLLRLGDSSRAPSVERPSARPGAAERAHTSGLSRS